MGFRPPPGGPIAARNWMSCRTILDVSFVSYLKEDHQMFYLLVITSKNPSSVKLLKIKRTPKGKQNGSLVPERAHPDLHILS